MAILRYKFKFSFADMLVAKVGGITLHQFHFDAESIVKAFESVNLLAKRLDVSVPIPRMAGFAYPHVSTLGVEVVFPEDSEPKPSLIIKNPEDIDKLREPEEYLDTLLIRRKLAVLEKLKKYRPEAPNIIGHLFEGPVTTAVLLMGQDFLTLPYDDPERAHKLLSFCTQSILNYVSAITGYFGETIQPGPKGIPDDFAGMFPPPVFEEFVVPYWEKIYQGLKATERRLHSELLRKEHLPFLKQLDIKSFDPSADQYLTPEILAEYCPCDFTLRIQSWDIDNLSAEELEERYLHLHKYKPLLVYFDMKAAKEEPKIKRLLSLAKKQAFSQKV